MDTIRTIKNILEKYFREGKADKIKDEAVLEIKLALKRNKIPFNKYKNQIYKLTKEVEKELEKSFMDEKVKPIDENVKKQLNELIKKSNFAVTELQQKIEKELIKSLNSGDFVKSLERGLRKIKVAERHINTEIFTTKAALDNLKRSMDYKKAGVKYLRYAGPLGTERPFCKLHIDRVYRFEEVEEMLNNFGQPALIYCGGYNCRHRWEAMFGEMKEDVYVDYSWQNAYNKASKNERKVMDEELNFAKKLTKLGNKIELNNTLTKLDNKDTDLLFNGIPAQLKTKSTDSVDSLVRALQDAVHQADLVIVDLLKENKDLERAIRKAKKWLITHNGKRLYYYYKDNLEEITYG